jgi:hypothetical protein
MKKHLSVLTALVISFSASAKLPPLSDEAKAKAAEAAAKTAHGNKVADFQLCKSREKVAAHYFKTPACVDPGAYKPAEVAAAPAAAAPAPAAAKPEAAKPAAAKKG